MFPRALTAVLVLLLLLAVAPARASAGPDPLVDPVGVWPLSPEPEVVAGFDPPDDPWGAGHRGVDLAGLPGQSVRAAMAGRVTFAGQLAGRGVVVVDHGDTRTTYEPVVAIVHVGDRVDAGGVIGRLSVPLSHCFPRACLHWGWLRDDTYLNPLELVGDTGPVRLLPLWRDRPVSPSPVTALPLASWWRSALTMSGQRVGLTSGVRTSSRPASSSSSAGRSLPGARSVRASPCCPLRPGPGAGALRPRGGLWAGP